MKMKKVLEELDKISDNYGLTSFKRRENLIKSMQELENRGTDCSKCPGFCCTYYHNSMQISPLEAIEILIDLKQQERLNQELIARLEENVQNYRLHVEVTDGRGRVLRRNYTCPFFKDHSLGCSISLEYKPYGCLGFNPDQAGVSSEGKCSSNLEQLEARSKGNQVLESKVNLELKSSLKLYWDKKPIPTALLDIIKLLS
jgi:Fe-S-cluster containining protein